MAYQSEIEKLQRRYDEKPEQWFAALADAYRKAGEIDVALEIVRSGIAERPNYVSGHIVLGRCLVDQGNDEEAGNVFAHVLQLDAENIIALKVLGDVAERSGDSAGAREWLERLLEVDPMNDEARAARERLETETAAVEPTEQTADSEAPVSEVIEETDVAGQVASGALESDVVEAPPQAHPAEPEHPSQPPTAERAEPEQEDLAPAEFGAPSDGVAASVHGLEPTSLESPVDELDSTPAESIVPEPTDPRAPINDPFRPRDITPPSDDDFVIVRQSDPFEAVEPVTGVDKPASEDSLASTTADPGEDDVSNLWAALGSEPELQTVPDAESIAARVAAAADQARPAEPEPEEAVEPVGPGWEAEPTEDRATGLDLDETTDEMPAITLDALSERERADAESRDSSAATIEPDAPAETPDDERDQVSSQSDQEAQGPPPVADIEPTAEEEFVPVADSLPEYHVDAPPPRPAGSAPPEAPVEAFETVPAPQVGDDLPDTEPPSAPTPDTLSEQADGAAVSEVVEDSWTPSSFTQPPGEIAQEAEPVASAEPEPDVTPTMSEAPSSAEPSFAPEPVPNDEPAIDEPAAPPWGGDDRAVSEVALEDEEDRVGARDDAEPATVSQDTPEPESALLRQDPDASEGPEGVHLHEVTPDVEGGPAVGPSDGDVVVTETMAEVYAAQGLTHQAREVYQALLALDPGNATLEAGLAALEVSGTTKTAGTAPEVAPSYAAALTGGTNVKAFLADVLAARPDRLDLDSVPPKGPDDDLDAPTAMDTAFAEDETEDAQPAPDDEMSLATVFGDEAPQGEPRNLDAAPVDGPDGSNSGMSFDQFFGTAAPSTDTADESPGAPDESPAAEPGSPPDEEDAGEDDEDFKAWLKSLKS